jgi:hypothetical protein
MYAILAVIVGAALYLGYASLAICIAIGVSSYILTATLLGCVEVTNELIGEQTRTLREPLARRMGP